MKINKIAASALLVASASFLHSGSASALTAGHLTANSVSSTLNSNDVFSVTDLGNELYDIRLQGSVANNGNIFQTGNAVFSLSAASGYTFEQASLSLNNIPTSDPNLVTSVYSPGPTIVNNNGVTPPYIPFAAGVTSTTVTSTVGSTSVKAFDNYVQLKQTVPFEFSPEQGFMLGVPLFLGLRQLKKRTAAKKQIS